MLIPILVNSPAPLPVLPMYPTRARVAFLGHMHSRHLLCTPPPTDPPACHSRPLPSIPIDSLVITRRLHTQSSRAVDIPGNDVEATLKLLHQIHLSLTPFACIKVCRSKACKQQVLHMNQECHSGITSVLQQGSEMAVMLQAICWQPHQVT